LAPFGRPDQMGSVVEASSEEAFILSADRAWTIFVWVGFARYSPIGPD